MPWKDMELGDSFFSPAYNPDTSFRALYEEAKEHGIRVTINKTIYGGMLGYRITRVK